MTLQEQGFRFYASPDRNKYRWIHPDEKAAHYEDWIDCTDMSDDELAAFTKTA